MAGWSSTIRRPRDGIAVAIRERFIIALWGVSLFAKVWVRSGGKSEGTYWSQMLDWIFDHVLSDEATRMAK